MGKWKRGGTGRKKEGRESGDKRSKKEDEQSEREWGPREEEQAVKDDHFSFIAPAPVRQELLPQQYSIANVRKKWGFHPAPASNILSLFPTNSICLSVCLLFFIFFPPPRTSSLVILIEVDRCSKAKMKVSIFNLYLVHYVFRKFLHFGFQSSL